MPNGSHPTLKAQVIEKLGESYIQGFNDALELVRQIPPNRDHAMKLVKDTASKLEIENNQIPWNDGLILHKIDPHHNEQ